MELPFKANLDGKTAVIISDGGYLCRTFSMALALAGANVAILDATKEDADEFVVEINKAGGRSLGFAADLLDASNLKEIKEVINREFGLCDILVNTTRASHRLASTTREYLYKEDLENKEDKLITFFDLDPDAVLYLYKKNLLGVLIPAQVFAKDMVGRDGSIINCVSLNSYRPLTKHMGYSASKAAVAGFTKWLAVHFSKVGIRVNGIATGFVMTEGTKPYLLNPDGTLIPRAQKELDHIPMGRMADPWEFAGALLWLADGKASGFVTGAVIPVDGGFTAYSGV